MARPQNFDRNEVLAKAMNLFWLKGYKAVSVQDVAKAMEISRSSFYNSFEDKETIFNEVMKFYGASIPCLRLEQIPPGDPVVPVIKDIFYEVCRRSEESGPKGCLLIDSIASDQENFDSKIREEISTQMQSRMELYITALKKAQAQGEIDSKKDPEKLAEYIMTNLIGLMTMSKVISNKTQLRSIAEQAFSVFD